MTNQYEILDHFYNDEKAEMICVRFPDGKVHEYFYRTMDDVREMYENDGKICLDHCYIKDFDYEKLYDSKTVPKLELGFFDAYGAFFDGSSDFKGARFSEWAYFENATFSGKADFVCATFSNMAYFDNATFSGWTDFVCARFSDWANFKNAKFSGMADFENATFSGRAYFENTKFSGWADFNFATFSGEANFEGVNFSEEAHFLGATFSEEARFENAKFSGEADFLGARFSKRADFSGATFSAAEFKSATFNDAAYFNSIDCSGRLLFAECIFKNKVSFIQISIDTLVFDNCTNEYLLDMHSQPQEINSLAFKYLNNFGHFNLNWKAYKTALIKGVNDENEESEKGRQDYRIDQFKMLKENFHNLGDYDAEDEAYIEYKRVQRQYYGKNLKGRIRHFLSFVFDQVGRYGTDPIRVLGWMIGVIAVFSIVFSNLIPYVQIAVNDAQITSSVIRSIYFSTVTFFTIGYGDIAPASNLAAVLVCVEGFLGAFLMSFFSVSVVRKILR